MEEKHIADYFIISGVSENPEFNTESKQLINSVLPITDVTVIFRGLGEQCPAGYICIETTPGGHLADLNNGNFKSPNIQICYKRGNDKPPLVDVGVYHEDKERVLPDVEVVYTTPYGRCASTGNNGSKSGTFITYRRAKTNSPFNQLVVVDLCVILNNKSEHPPHAFYSIKKNLNKSYYGMIGSEVFICYKKTLFSPPSLCYTPQIVSRFPLQDYANFPLPSTVPLFCLPTGANIELWPANVPLPKPVASTFVLTSDSAQKMYGSALSFYEFFDSSRLAQDQKSRLSMTEENDGKYKIYAIKSICILSRWPFFECFEKFLTFLHKLVFNQRNPQDEPGSPTHRNNVSLEHYISHFLLDVSFPTPQRPTVLIQLMPGGDETVTISQPSSRLPLPLTGASFIQLLSILGVENTMNVLLFGLSEQKILLHSLRPWVLTGVAEAISAMLFPFHWQCPYVPLCPLSLHGILNAPLPFIVGIDSRCFDTFTPPDDIICIDLDTRSIFLSELKKCLNLRILPKRAARVLRSSLEKIFQKTQRVFQAMGASQSPQHRMAIMEANRKQIEKKLELEIQEAFVRFMATILRGFRSYLLPITRAPTIGATDPTSLFDFEGFLMSRDRNYNQFYQLITKTQMFTHYIEERSFVSDKDTSLAFFDDCEEKLIASDDIFSDRPIKLFDKEDGLIQTDRSVYIPAPEQSPSVNSNSNLSNTQQAKSVRFGPLNSALFHRHPQVGVYPSIDRALNDSARIDSKLLFDNHSNEFNSSFSISRRTKQEVKASQKLAKKSAETPLDWSKYLVSCCYCLWFSSLPAYIGYCKSANQDDSNNHNEISSKNTSRILRYAYSTIVRMQKLGLNTDEICFRVLTLLCGHYGQPALAVRVFFEMKKAGIKPNAVTYGYYNKAVLESKWPDHSSKPTTVLWTKIRNVVSGIALFKSHGRMRMHRRNMRFIPLAGDAAFSRPDLDVVDRATQYSIVGDFFHPTTLPIEHDRRNSSYNALNQHRSLVNRSFSTYSKTNSTEANNSIAESDVPQHKSFIHKSYSMHLRDGSPDRSMLVKTKSSSLEDEEEPVVIPKSVAPIESSAKRAISALDNYLNTRERHQLLNVDSDSVIIKNIDLIDNSAGILFTTSPRSFRAIMNTLSSSLIDFEEKDTDPSCLSNQTPNNFLRSSNLTTNNHHITDANEFLKSNSFGEDSRILRKLESRDQKPDFSGSIDCLGADETSDGKSNRLSESTLDPSESLAGQDEDYDMKNITSTPNFKLSSLINEASNLQWSKWTSSQNSKSVYKGIKSAATGIVSSLQEIKSSFSISNSNTPSKLLTSAHHKSTATREMLSQWANYFSSQPSRGDADSDNSSLGSNDLLRLSNDEDAELSTTEASDFLRLFEDLERYYGNSNSKEDLIGHLSSDLECANKDQIAIEIQMTTCSRCNVCRSLLYDEEIMERWSHNESNLNTRCVYCRAKIVPLMSVQVEDRRFETKSSNKRTCSPENGCETANNLVDLYFGNEVDSASNHYRIKGSSDALGEVRDGQSLDSEHRQSFTVPYLSPIVLRKELESVFESSGDACPASSRFVDEHPIIYWNLLWYFSRINAPTHLALLCLKSKSILKEQEIPEEWLDSQKVVVRTLWDNEKLHSEIGKPLYRLWERGDPSSRVQAILCDNLYFTYSFLGRVINFLEANELGKAMNLILNARLKSSTKFSFDKNRHNLYRDLIFLAIKALGPAKLSRDNFEREYKKAFESLNFQQVALNRFDRPPTIGSLFCRKCFKELSLDERVG